MNPATVSLDLLFILRRTTSTSEQADDMSLGLSRWLNKVRDGLDQYSHWWCGGVACVEGCAKQAFY